MSGKLRNFDESLRMFAKYSEDKYLELIELVCNLHQLLAFKTVHIFLAE